MSERKTTAYVLFLPDRGGGVSAYYSGVTKVLEPLWTGDKENARLFLQRTLAETARERINRVGTNNVSIDEVSVTFRDLEDEPTISHAL